MKHFLIGFFSTTAIVILAFWTLGIFVHKAVAADKYILPSGIIIYEIRGTEPMQVCGGIVPFDSTKKEYDVIVDDGAKSYTPFKTLREAVKYTEKYCRPVQTFTVTAIDDDNDKI